MNVEIVVGANYGDEGKGLFSEYLSAKYDNSIVMLTNGGCQRGHTVNDPKYGKFVFHHFGSGVFRQRPTYFMHSFLLNPMQFVKEYSELLEKGIKPICYRHPDCKFQIPIDILLNRYCEIERGENRLGSVGCGIWESMKRIKTKYSYTLADFLKLSYNEQYDFLKITSYEYLVNEVGLINMMDFNHLLNHPCGELLDTFLSDGFINHFISDLTFMAHICKPLSETDLHKFFKTVIIEQGQGLMLDPKYIKDIDHTTPSNPGTCYIAELLKADNMNIDKIDVNYISRTYLTRHGAGNLENEISGTIGTDLTNIENEWQGKLRYGELSYDTLQKRIKTDFNMLKKTGINCDKHLVFTHVNEVDVNHDVISKGDFLSYTDKANDIIII